MGGGRIFVMIAFRISCPSLCYPKIVKQNIHRTIIMPLVLRGCDTWVSQTKGQIQSEGQMLICFKPGTSDFKGKNNPSR